MVKKTITFTDYNGVERTEDFYFNLTEAELAEMNLTVEGGMQNQLEKIVQAKDIPSIVRIMKKMIFESYGEKSADGRRFIKSEELSTAFSQTEAYSKLFMELSTDAQKAADFMNSVIPDSLAAKIKNQN